MKLSQTKSRLLALLSAVAIVSIGSGLLAGHILKSHHQNSSAASTNITVVGNDQLISRDQSTSIITIEQQSTVTIRNSEANYGYTLKAKLGQNTLTSSTITIASPTSTDCPIDTPCPLNTSTPATILTTTDNTATDVDGDTTTFTVTITIPAGAAVSDYVLDIEYAEETIIVLPLADGEIMQAATRQRCEVTPIGTMVNLKDTRDGTYYRVKKMIDGNCWMVDNLAYDINSAPAEGKPVYNPVAVLISGTTTSVDTAAQYAQNNNIESQGQIPNNGNPKASYLYNWCAALGDISPNCRASATYNASANPYGAQINQTVIKGVATTNYTATNQPEVQGICPAPFRLPRGGPDADPANNGTNTALAIASTASEPARLDIAMGGLGVSIYPANTYPNFTGTTTDANDWFGVRSGYNGSGLGLQGTHGYWWTSTAYSTTIAYGLGLNLVNSHVRPAGPYDRYRGQAVRCLL